jgi:hypothetical protein
MQLCTPLLLPLLLLFLHPTVALLSVTCPKKAAHEVPIYDGARKPRGGAPTEDLKIPLVSSVPEGLYPPVTINGSSPILETIQLYPLFVNLQANRKLFNYCNFGEYTPQGIQHLLRKLTGDAGNIVNAYQWIAVWSHDQMIINECEEGMNAEEKFILNSPPLLVQELNKLKPYAVITVDDYYFPIKAYQFVGTEWGGDDETSAPPHFTVGKGSLTDLDAASLLLCHVTGLQVSPSPLEPLLAASSTFNIFIYLLQAGNAFMLGYVLYLLSSLRMASMNSFNKIVKVGASFSIMLVLIDRFILLYDPLGVLGRVPYIFSAYLGVMLQSSFAYAAKFLILYLWNENLGSQ